MQAFENRLTKVNRHISKWANRQGITCYRIYDMDMPEFPLCIERYESYLHVSEYKARHGMDDDEHQDWLNSVLDIASEVTAIPRENIFLKERKRLARREEQYEKMATESKEIIAHENNLQFHINLTDYLDTGLFLDHRPLRETFRNEAEGKNVLNLFAYTGSFSVNAAAGKAAAITTVDLSNTYLERAKDNFRLNSLLDERKHHFVQSDTMDFLKNYNGELFDLVFADPPAFSNSKKMHGTWDTQRDHSPMLNLILKLVQPGGVIYFSNNLRNFTPETNKWRASSVNNITAQTIPEDFRNKKIHHCYKLLK